MAEKGDHIADSILSDPAGHFEPDFLEASERYQLESLKLEVAKLRCENSALTDVKKRDALLLQMRSRLLEHIESNARALKTRCEEWSVHGVKDEVNTRSFEVLYNNLAEKQRQCWSEEQTIHEIEHNNVLCKTLRDKLSDTLKQLEKENLWLRRQYA